MKQPYATPGCLEQVLNPVFQRHALRQIAVHYFVDRCGVPYRMICVNQDMPVGSKTDPAAIHMGPANGDNPVLPGIQTGQLKINGDQWSIDKLGHLNFGTFRYVAGQTLLPALL